MLLSESVTERLTALITLDELEVRWTLEAHLARRAGQWSTQIPRDVCYAHERTFHLRYR